LEIVGVRVARVLRPGAAAQDDLRAGPNRAGDGAQADVERPGQVADGVDEGAAETGVDSRVEDAEVGPDAGTTTTTSHTAAAPAAGGQHAEGRGVARPDAVRGGVQLAHADRDRVG